MQIKTLIPILLLLLLMACDESSTTLFSLKEEDFDSEMEDSLLILVDRNGGELQLTGNLLLIEGKCIVSMASPVLDTTFKDVMTFVRDTALSDTTYDERIIEEIDTVYVADTIFSIDTVWGTVTIDTVKIDSIFVKDTIFSVDTVVNNQIVYKKTFKATNKYSIDQKFDRILGTWIFRYSLENLESDVDPDGDLDFNVKYEN